MAIHQSVRPVIDQIKTVFTNYLDTEIASIDATLTIIGTNYFKHPIPIPMLTNDKLPCVSIYAENSMQDRQTQAATGITHHLIWAVVSLIHDSDLEILTANMHKYIQAIRQVISEQINAMDTVVGAASWKTFEQYYDYYFAIDDKNLQPINYMAQGFVRIEVVQDEC